jgi:hypothetical protein
MAFIRSKPTSTGPVHYLVKSYREDGKVKQRVLLYLGHASTPEEALWYAVDDLAGAYNRRSRLLKSDLEVMTNKLELERAERGILHWHSRIAKLLAFAEKPVCPPDWDFMDDDVQRLWQIWQEEYGQMRRTDIPLRVVRELGWYERK